MAPVEESQTEAEGSSQVISLRSDVSGNHVDDGEGGTSIRRKRRKKKDQRPESIIVYRSEVEPDEDHGGEEGARRSTEERDKFLCTPTSEGELDLLIHLHVNQMNVNKGRFITGIVINVGPRWDSWL